MKYTTNSSWEHKFNEQALQVEEFLSSGQITDYEKSRLRLALENNILNWREFKEWHLAQLSTAVFRDDLSLTDIINLNEIYFKNRNLFINQEIFSDDLIPLTLWNGHPIILGLMYNEKINLIPHSIFILCSHETLNKIQDPYFLNKITEATWSQMDTKYDGYCSLARKNFDAFVVLKIKDNSTVLYKMDDDLVKEKIDLKNFQHSLLETNVFSNAMTKNQSYTINLKLNNIQVLDYTTGVITPLKKGKTTVGFLLGLKLSEINTFFLLFVGQVFWL